MLVSSFTLVESLMETVAGCWIQNMSTSARNMSILVEVGVELARVILPAGVYSTPAAA